MIFVLINSNIFYSQPSFHWAIDLENTDVDRYCSFCVRMIGRFPIWRVLVYGWCSISLLGMSVFYNDGWCCSGRTHRYWWEFSQRSLKDECSLRLCGKVSDMPYWMHFWELQKYQFTLNCHLAKSLIQWLATVDRISINFINFLLF
jgi:hypothetical protein